MLEAEKTGVNALGVSWGYHPKKTLQKGNPITIASKPADIVFEVNQYFKG
jgi:phosphoglycolate phosphatase-like HAD superfamily hydrolase